MSGAARRSSLPGHGAPPVPPPDPSPPVNGGEFLLQLLRRPPQSNPSPPLRRPFEDPAVALVGPGHSLSPPSFPDPSPPSHPFPPWAFRPILPTPPHPNQAPHLIRGNRDHPPGFAARHPLVNENLTDPGLLRFGSFDAERNPRARDNKEGTRFMRFPEAVGQSVTRDRDRVQVAMGMQEEHGGQGVAYSDRLSGSGDVHFAEWGRGKREERGLDGRGAAYSDRTRGSVDVQFAEEGWGKREERGLDGRGVTYPDWSSGSRDVEFGADRRRYGKGNGQEHGFDARYGMGGSVGRPLRVEKEGGIRSGVGANVPVLPESLLSDNEEEEDGASQSRLEVRSASHVKTVGEDDVVIEKLTESLVLKEEHNESNETKKMRGSRGKDYRLDTSRGHSVSSQRVRYRRAGIPCRHDINRLTPYFLSIYKSLIPEEEEKAKLKQLLSTLEKLVYKEWPDAQLHVYGSCANSFGVSNSDIDICLAIDDSKTSKSEILLKLADILESDNFQNVQALTHARVPIVKLKDPVTGISCDICINNLLAVVNTKLLRDYAHIDERLRQLAFIVKHWAKSRGVNETYQGTLSSYAYVLMCIHFLQSRRPAILPCLQEMKATYRVTVDNVECSFYDQVEKLGGFGARNKESISELLWAFFNYWAYCHDYANDVISIRVGGIVSKYEKDWMRRIGNDRHLICIEDPFETSHDLGRVVDKFSIKILREEFERAADILQFDRNPSVTLFEPYIKESPPI